MKVLEGALTGVEGKVGIVFTRWNEFIVDKLYEGAVQRLKRLGIEESNVVSARCPGAYEIPYTAQQLIKHASVEGVVCLGVVIRGGTPHFDYVAGAVNSGIQQLNMQQDKPVIFGILTTDTIDQAVERAGTKAGNKGAEAAEALVEMISLSDTIRGQSA